MAFRDFSYPSVLEKLGLTQRQSDLSVGAPLVPVRDGFAAFFEECLAIAVGDVGICTEKAKSEFIIAPLLVELRRAMERRFSIFSGMELNVNKARGLNGACDYVLTKGDNQHLREAPILGVLEAKNEEYSQQGLGQCIASMVAAQARNRKAGWTIGCVFGARTTGRSWQFLRLEGAVLTNDRTTYRLDDLGQILGLLKLQIEYAAARPQLLTPASEPLVTSPSS